MEYITHQFEPYFNKAKNAMVTNKYDKNKGIICSEFTGEFTNKDMMHYQNELSSVFRGKKDIYLLTDFINAEFSVDTFFLF
jgi:hypothetical protein